VRIRFNFFSMLIALAFLSSCKGLKHLPEGRYLLDKNTIKINQPELREQITALIKQKPNRKILGVARFHMGVYQLADRGKDSKFNKWLKNTVGEPPQLLDTILTKRTVQQIQMLMENNGYFNALATDSIRYSGRKATVIYHVNGGTPYRIRSITYKIPDTAVAAIVFADTAKSKIQTGEVYNTTTFQKERERISNNLRNEGYYFFNPQYISYKADTSLSSHQLNLYINFANSRSQVKDSLEADTSTTHRMCYYSDIIVEMDYDPILASNLINKDTLQYKGFHFISNAQARYLYKPGRVLDHVFIFPDSLFRQSNLDLTYRRLADLGVFRFVNIRFEQGTGVDSAGNIPLKGWLLLSPQARQEYKIEAEGTNSGGNLGIAGRFTYRNKNIFKGAESLVIRLKAGLELQRNFSDTTYESIKQFGFFNAYEFGPEVSLNFPRFLVPFKFPFQSRINNPSTSIATGINVQNRPEYYRQLFNMSFYYTWKTSASYRHYVYPAEINFLNVTLDPIFEEQLIALNDINLLLGYTDQLISNGRYSFIFSNQSLSSFKNYSFFRFNFESAGNSLYLSKKLQGEAISPENPGEIFGIRFAQYIRPDFDYRFYHVLAQEKTMVYRINAGVGYSYGNALLMPFEKSFFAGGPNDNRAWRSRSIGPGSSLREDYYERYGDIKIGGNIEYRFDIIRKFKGAAFIDAGNVWLIRDFNERPGGSFKLDSFFNEMAIGGGLGLRFDLTFFIIRVDGAVQLKDPSMPEGDRWVFRANGVDDVIFNFGIGYPF
jgi:outer membrane protein assembly factor BamA